MRKIIFYVLYRIWWLNGWLTFRRPIHGRLAIKKWGLVKTFTITLIFCLWASTAWAAHPIASAQFTEGGSIHVVMDDGRQFDVPDDPSNRHRQQLAEWVTEGNTIAPYVAPPPPTNDERIDSVFTLDDKDRVFFEAFFELTNRVIALEGGAAITRTQLRDSLKAKLP